MATSEVKNWVLNIAGRKVSMAAPNAGQFLKWNQSLNTWEPQDLGTFTHEIISDWNTAVDSRIAAQKGQANGIASLGPDGKIPSAQIPALALTNVQVVNSESAQLALTGMEAGDVVIRTDISKTFIHNGGTSGTMADYTEVLAPPPPVISVNGQTGSVVLNTDNIAEGTANLYYTSARVAAEGVGGDLTGTIGNATVAKIRNISVSATAPSNGNVLVYDSNTNAWVPGTPTSITSAHTHAISDITGLQAALNAKVDTSAYNAQLESMIQFLTYTVDYSAGEFQQNANAVDIELFELPANAKITGITVKHSSAFAGSGITAMSVSLGSKVGTVVDPEFYAMPFDVAQTPASDKFHDADMFLSKVSTAHKVVARFTANANVGTGSATNLTSGSVTIRVGYVPFGPPIQ